VKGSISVTVDSWLLSNDSLLQVFLLVTEGLVKKHQRGLADEMETTVSELIARAEQGLAALQKKEASLQSKVRNHQMVSG
jgi:Spc19